MQGCVYSSVVLASGARSMYAVGSDKVLRELEESAGGNTTASAEIDTGCVLTKIAVPQRMHVAHPGSTTRPIQSCRSANACST